MKAMRIWRRAAWSLAGVALVTACGGSSGPNSNATVSQTEASAIADQAANDLASSVNGLVDFSGGFGGLTGGFFAPSALRNRAFAQVARVAPGRFQPAILAFSLDSGCTPAIVGDTSDTDGNGIPVDVTYTFTAGNCSYDDGQGNQIALSGTIHIQDRLGGNILFGYAVEFGNWSVKVVTTSPQGTQTGVFSIDGLQTAGVSSGSAASAEVLTYTVKINGTRVYKYTAQTNVGYHPTSGSIDPANQSRLQSGDFVLTGRFHFTGDATSGAAGSWSFGLETTSPLAYDVACLTELPFTAGEIVGRIEANQSAGFAIDYGPSCGQSTVTAFNGAFS